MLPRLNGGVWMEDRDAGAGKDELGSFKAMLEVEDEWYSNTNHSNKDLTFTSTFADPESLQLHNHIDSSSSCSPSSSVFNNPSSQLHYYLNQHHHHNNNPSLSSLHGFDLASEIGFLDSQDLNLMSSNTHMQPQTMSHLLENSTSSFSGFRGGDVLRPLEPLSSVEAMPTLFQKRTARNLSGYENERKRKKLSGGDEGDDLSLDGSGLRYDSDEFRENNNNKVDVNGENVGIGCNAGGDGENKGKKKGLHAKNLMAERRRRKKLNDRLYMLQSVVPRISKMDRASILGDAIEYLQELLQRINNLHNELESLPPGSALTPTASTLHPLTPTPLTLPSRVKEELCPSLPSPSGQPARVEVRLREGRVVNIHMFCGRRPGLLLSTMMVVDNLGLDIQQAVISCFNGFAMDIFQAEQCKEGQDVHRDHIKAVLLDSAEFHNMM